MKRYKVRRIVKRKDGQIGHIDSVKGSMCLFVPWDCGTGELQYHKDLVPTKWQGKTYHKKEGGD